MPTKSFRGCPAVLNAPQVDEVQESPWKNLQWT
jgi:hypothetical protein